MISIIIITRFSNIKQKNKENTLNRSLTVSADHKVKIKENGKMLYTHKQIHTERIITMQ